jgi:RNA polymerase sigma factor (TIGR02999 family)
MSRPAKKAPHLKDGPSNPFDQFIPVVYRQLRRIAQNQIRNRTPGQTLSPTDLVHEAFLRLRENKGIEMRDRSHFFAIAAQCMRWVLTDYAKAKGRAKRGGDLPRIRFQEELHVAGEGEDYDLAALDEVLEKLAEQDPRLSRVAELRFLAGLSIEETAEVLEVSLATVKRDWKLARAWLFRELQGKQSDGK